VEHGEGDVGGAETGHWLLQGNLQTGQRGDDGEVRSFEERDGVHEQHHQTNIRRARLSMRGSCGEHTPAEASTVPVHRVHSTAGDDWVFRHPHPNLEPGEFVHFPDGPDGGRLCAGREGNGATAALLEVVVAPRLPTIASSARPLPADATASGGRAEGRVAQ